MPFNLYLTHPLTSEGIPTENQDAEYYLKSPTQRIPDGLPRRFLELCQSKNLARIEAHGFWFDGKLFSDPDCHPLLVELYGRPLEILSHKLSGLKTFLGKTIPLVLCSAHTNPFTVNPETLEDPTIWADVAKKYNLGYIDLNDAMAALSLSYFPLTERFEGGHFNPDGHQLFSLLLAHELIRQGFLPTGTAKP